MPASTSATPVSVRAWAAERGVDFEALGREQRHAQVAALGRHLMDEVARLIPGAAGAAGGPPPCCARRARHWAPLELKAEVGRLVQALETRGARLYLPRGDWDYAVDAGLRMLTLRHLVVEQQGLYTAHTHELPLLAYYANSIAHLVDAVDPSEEAP